LADHLPATEGQAPNARAPKVIKRYTNRKLYDTVESRYVTLVEIGQMVKDGVEVQIIDNRTKDDLTSITLTQIIFEEEKKASRMPLSILRDMIRGGGDKLSFLAGEVNTRVSAIRAEAENVVARALRRDEEAEPVGAVKDGRKTSPRAQAAEFVRNSRAAIEEWQGHLDERLHRAMETVTTLPTLHREVQALRDKLEELEQKLAEPKE